MYIYNVTFVVSPEKESPLLDYIRKNLLPSLFNADSPARDPELRKVVEAGGEKPAPEHGLSIALAASFETETEVRRWKETFLIPALADFNIKFASQALFFETLLEVLPL